MVLTIQKTIGRYYIVQNRNEKYADLLSYVQNYIAPKLDTNIKPILADF